MSINIALIDSGVNPSHFHVREIEKGLCFYLNSESRVVQGDDFTDITGHGTAIAGVIKQKASFARLYAVKIFFENLRAPAQALMAALKWAIYNNMKIIHLSLGIKQKKHEKCLKELCDQAYEKGVVIVAAARRLNDNLFPSAFENVIGVYRNHECGENTIFYHPGSSVEFGAYGSPRPLPGLPQKLNFSGSSFAAAHVTGKVAQLLKNNPDANMLQVKDMLIKNSLQYPV